MEIRTFSGSAVIATTIEGLNSREMRQMYEMRLRIEQVLASHKGDAKKEYLTDSELKLIGAMLYCFTKHMEGSLESSFDKVVKRMHAVEKSGCVGPEATTI